MSRKNIIYSKSCEKLENIDDIINMIFNYGKSVIKINNGEI